MRGGGLQLVLLLAVFGLANGSYRFGTLSWRHIRDAPMPNTVEFNLVTAWTRDFKWVYVSQADAPAGSPARQPSDKPIVGDILRITGLTFADSTGSMATSQGSSAIVFNTGDGTKHFVDVEVQAYSEAENWVMGNFTVRHSYSTPYMAKGQNQYYNNFQYDASNGAALDANQPFLHVPWTASFDGCCRWGGALDANRNKMYRVETTIDLTDRDNAPAARILPIVSVPNALGSDAGAQPSFYVLARDQYVPGRMEPVAMSSADTNYPVNDNTAAPLKFELAGAAKLGFHSADSYVNMTCGPVAAASRLPCVHSVDLNTGKVTIQTNGTSAAAQRGYYQIAIVVTSGSSKTVVDFQFRVVERDPQPMATDRAGMELMGDMAILDEVHGWVGYNIMADVMLKGMMNEQLVLNYVFASLSVEATSVQGNGVMYSMMQMDHQGLPAGAQLASVADMAVVDMKITFDNPFPAHRPGHDAALNRANRDYTGAPGAKDLWDQGYRPVLMVGHMESEIQPLYMGSTLYKAAFDMNKGSGGAAVYLWLKRASDEPAITEVRISDSEDDEEAWEEEGFHKIDMNVNEQSSSSTEVYIYFKKGSGPPLLDVAMRDDLLESSQAPPSDYMVVKKINPVNPAAAVDADLNSGSERERKLKMYLQKQTSAMVSRMLHWVPQMAGHYIFCYAASVVGNTEATSTQRCIHMDIRNDPAPMFMPVPNLQTLMGKILIFNISYHDITHPQENVMIMESTTGIRLGNARFVGHPIVEMIDSRVTKTTRTVEWFPDSTYGGFSASVCYTASDWEPAGRDVTMGCVNITVDRCQWYVQTEDTLIQVAARFGTNWLQVWHFNPLILHPDSALQPGSTINTGHMYSVEPNDAMGVLAERFGTMIEHIKLNNWDLQSVPDSALPVGKHICVVPSSCVTAQHVQRGVAV